MKEEVRREKGEVKWITEEVKLKGSNQKDVRKLSKKGSVDNDERKWGKDDVN